MVHTRLILNDSLYDKVYDIDFSKYDMTLLGGDLNVSFSKQNAVLSHLDSIFNFKSPNRL